MQANPFHRVDNQSMDQGVILLLAWTNSVIIVNKFIQPEANRPIFTLTIVINVQCLGTIVNDEAAACISYFACGCCGTHNCTFGIERINFGELYKKLDNDQWALR